MNIHCSVCLEPTECISTPRNTPIKPKGSDSKILKCKHVFHKECLSKWIATCEKERPMERSTCPCCRAPIANRHRVLWIRYIERTFFENEDILDKYIYYDFTHLILFLNHIKQSRLHYLYACFCKTFKRTKFVQ